MLLSLQHYSNATLANAQAWNAKAKTWQSKKGYLKEKFAGSEILSS